MEQQKLAFAEMQRQAEAQHAIPSQTGQVHLEDTMPPEDFRAAGLAKLTPEELATLDRWLTSRLAQVVESVRQTGQASIAVSQTSLPTPPKQPKALLLYGGTDHKTFLGCLNCVATAKSSVCNEFEKYGSSFQSDSIWNSFGTFGSEFNPQSPWNSFSSVAPIIVDSDGGSYGHFSANSFHNDRTRIDWLVSILDSYSKSSDLEKTRKLMCGD